MKNMLKKALVGTMLAATIFTLAACGEAKPTDDSNKPNDTPPVTDGGDKQNPQVPNPTEIYQSIEDAMAALSFEAKIPAALADEYEQGQIAVINKKVLEVTYTKDGNMVVYRTAEGEGDISGDYTEYAQTNTVTIGEYEVETRGSDDTVSIALWNADGMAYSLTFGQAVTAEALDAIVESL